MVTFRFYVVSTVAFFLALAVGVVVGSVLDGRIADSLQDRLGNVERSLDETVALMDDKNVEIDEMQRYIESSAAFAVQGRLEESTTMVVAESGLDAGAVEDLVRRLREAGSRVEGIVWLEQRWDLDDPADREAVDALLTEPADGSDAADLREALSTALCIEKNDDPWSRAALESAADRARTVKVKEAVPIQTPRFWPVPLALALSLVVVWLAVQDMDLFGARATALAKEQQKQQMTEAKFQVETATTKVEDLLSKLNAGLEKNDDKTEADAPEARTPDELRRDAIRKLTSIKDRLEELKAGEKSQTLQAMEKQLRQLRTPGDGPLTELSNQLSRGNFPKAADELQKMMEQLQSSDMKPEDKAALAEQLQKMAEQLQKLSEDRKEMEKALEKAGLDKNLAANPEALKQALEKNESLTQEQKEQLQKMAEAASKACEMCQSMGQSMESMSKSMSEQGMGEEGMEGMESLMSQLSELEQMASEMKMADAAKSECEAQLSLLSSFSMCEGDGMGECEGGLSMNESTRPWSEGFSEKEGAGSGGPGRGKGGAPGSQEAAYSMDKLKANSKNLGGPIISSRMVQGEQIRGESQAQFAAAVAAAEQQASEEIVNNVIPREYHDAVKHYFGNLKAKAQAEEVAAPKPAAAEPKKDGE